MDSSSDGETVSIQADEQMIVRWRQVPWGGKDNIEAGAVLFHNHERRNVGQLIRPEAVWRKPPRFPGQRTEQACSGGS